MRILALALLVLFPLWAFAGDREELLKELEALKERIQRLEERLAQVEAKAEEVEGTQRELAEIKEALKGIEIGFSATGLALGTIGNDENEGKDRVDGAIKASLEVSKEVIEGGRVTAVIEAVQGGKTSERVPSWWGVEDVVGGYEGDPKASLAELWYEQELLDGKLVVTLGKIDLSAYFDGNEVAGDETAQFLSPGFVHSAAIEFPDDNGPGMRATIVLSEMWDLSLGWGEADADWSELGKEPFFIGELGIHPRVMGRPGNYRFYAWWREKRGEEAIGRDGEKENGWGVGLSADQELTEGVKAFLRVGYQNEDLYPFDWAWSLGAEVGGSLWGREGDAFGVAYGMAMLSDEYEKEESEVGKDEGHLEAYYRLQLNDHLAFSPDLQVIWGAEGKEDFDPVVILGVRGHVEF